MKFNLFLLFSLISVSSFTSSHLWAMNPEPQEFSKKRKREASTNAEESMKNLKKNG